MSKESVSLFLGNAAGSRGAAIAFYTVTSIVPILMIVLAVSGLAFGRDAANGALFGEFRKLLGAQGARLLEGAVASAWAHSTGILATGISIVTLGFTASGVFVELQDALNALWDAKAPSGLRGLARARAMSLGLIVAFGFMLMVSLVINAALQSVGTEIDRYVPAGHVVLLIATFLVSFVLITIIFAAILRYLPAKHFAWRDVIAGAALSALLFSFGTYLIGLYLARSTTVSSLGAAGAVLALSFWVYYTAQIFLFGAAFARAYAHPKWQASQDAQRRESGRGQSKRVLIAE